MSAPRPSARVVVIGAGIVGAATAYYLSRAGVDVTLLEADTPSAGASGASDGAVSVASKRPGPMMRLARKARALYGDLAQQGILAQVFRTRATYLFARSEKEAALMQTHGRDLAQAGERVIALSRVDLLRKMPNLGANVLAGIEVPDDGHAIGYQVVNRLLSHAGIVPHRHTPVRRLTVAHGRVIGVQTDHRKFLADTVVLAAGLGSDALMGLDNVLIPRKGQLIVTDRATRNAPALPGQLMSAGYLAAKRSGTPTKSAISLVIDPLQTGQFLIGSSREDGCGDKQTDIRTVSAILREALEVYPPLARLRVIRTFAGVRTATRDGLPVVGRHPFLEGLVIATGFEGDGICLGPLMGAAAARLACDAEPEVDIAALSPARFLTTAIS